MKRLGDWLLLVVGLFLIAVGVGFIVQADMGILPTTCLPYVISHVAGITVGEAVVLFHGVLITGQVLILRKNYKIVRLLQIPVGICFGYIMDFTLFLLRGLNFSGNFVRWVLFLTGVLISAIGVSVEVIAGVATLATEGFVLAVSEQFSYQFGTMKFIFDIALVAISAIISLLFLHHIEGVREGTVLSAILVGLFSKQIISFCHRTEPDL